MPLSYMNEKVPMRKEAKATTKPDIGIGGSSNWFTPNDWSFIDKANPHLREPIVTSRKYTGPRFPMPAEYPTIAPYAPVKPEESRIQELTEMAAAPGIRSLRSGLNQLTSGSVANPNVRRMQMRSALEGYGTGLQSIMSGARGQAMTQYQPEYSQMQTAARTNWEVARQKELSDYQLALQQALQEEERLRAAGVENWRNPNRQPGGLRNYRGVY